MFAKSLAVVFAAAVISVSGLGIETPASLTQCGSVDITWSGKKAPFILSVLPSCDSNSDDPLVELPPMNATTYKWTVNVPSSTGAVAFAIIDAEGNEAYTDEVNIRKSDDATCLKAAVSSSSTAVSASVTGSASPVATPETPRTTLTASSATAYPSAPVNIGASAGSGSSSSSGSNSSNGQTTQDSQNSGAVAHAASVFAGVVGLATGILALF